MSGLPVMLQGLNTKYYKTNNLSDGVPTYRIDSYTLYFLIPIYGATIKRVNGKWVLARDHAFEQNVMEKQSSGSVFPYGTWDFGSQVVPVYE